MASYKNVPRIISLKFRCNIMKQQTEINFMNNISLSSVR